MVLRVLLGRFSRVFSQYFSRKCSNFWTALDSSSAITNLPESLHGLNLIHCSLTLPAEKNGRYRRTFAYVARTFRSDQLLSYIWFPGARQSQMTGLRCQFAALNDMVNRRNLFVSQAAFWCYFDISSMFDHSLINSPDAFDSDPA
jgi:hypothetical protein